VKNIERDHGDAKPSPTAPSFVRIGVLSHRLLDARGEKLVSFRAGDFLSIDYRCEDRKNVGELRGDVGAVRWVLTPSFRKPRSSPPKNRTVQPGDAFEDIAFIPGFEIVKF
jgi:hypothetical protein